MATPGAFVVDFDPTALTQSLFTLEAEEAASVLSALLANLNALVVQRFHLFLFKLAQVGLTFGLRTPRVFLVRKNLQF